MRKRSIVRVIVEEEKLHVFVPADRRIGTKNLKIRINVRL
jgi:hypothetical protein